MGLFNVFTQEVAIDLGTANTLIWLKQNLLIFTWKGNLYNNGTVHMSFDKTIING